MAQPGTAARVTGAVGWFAVAAVLVGLAVSLVPVDNPGVQTCGAPFLFLVRGEIDRIPDAEGRILRDGEVVQLDAAARERAFAHPCSERVAARAIPAGVIAVTGAVLGLAVMTTGIVSAWRRAAPPAPDPTPVPGEP